MQNALKKVEQNYIYYNLFIKYKNLYIKIINLKIDSHISRTKDFEIKIFGNTTIWDLKEIISKKVFSFYVLFCNPGR